MSLRNRLKRELVNLLKLKNRIIASIIILYLVLGLSIYTPGDSLSPGDFIDNSYNVKNYPYNTSFTPLNELNYSFLDSVEILDLNLVPQGLCITDEYYLITAYRDKLKELGELLVFDRATGTYLLSLGLDSYSHLGGIAYDGENIWICNSKDNVIERLDYTIINDLVLNCPKKILDIRPMMEVYPVDCKPSGITYYNEKLWIVTHNPWTNSQMLAYQYEADNNELIFQNHYDIPSQVQGVAFDDEGRVYFSISYGRRNSSFIKEFNSLDSLTKTGDNYARVIEMPPGSEQLWIVDNQIYILFESACEKYKRGTDGLGQSFCPLDKILVIDLAST